ncbi:MAG: hypothetical protein PHT07_22830 [Paludibacter sp.]|nr:hypothetical protein [Paludibacter sp.]
MDEFKGSNQNNYKHEYSDEYRDIIDRVVRWDKFRIDQLSITNNLILTLSLAFLGYIVKQDHEICNCDSCFYTIKIISIFLLFISLISGTWTSYNRLLDFRLTSKLTKKKKERYKHDQDIEAVKDIERVRFNINYLKHKTDRLGECTWVLLNIQILSFLIGSILGILFLIC